MGPPGSRKHCGDCMTCSFPSLALPLKSPDKTFSEVSFHSVKSTEHGFPFIFLPSEGLEKDFQLFLATASPL